MLIFTKSLPLCNHLVHLLFVTIDSDWVLTMMSRIRANKQLLTLENLLARRLFSRFAHYNTALFTKDHTFSTLCRCRWVQRLAQFSNKSVWPNSDQGKVLELLITESLIALLVFSRSLDITFLIIYIYRLCGIRGIQSCKFVLNHVAIFLILLEAT